MSGDDEIIKEFLVESYENLDQLDRDFVALEGNPTARDRIAGIFRTIHTIKGTSGFLGFTRLESLTHVGESLLSRLRDGALILTPEITTALLNMVDAVRKVLAHIEAHGVEGKGDDGPLIAALGRLQEGPTAAAPMLPGRQVHSIPAGGGTQSPSSGRPSRAVPDEVHETSQAVRDSLKPLGRILVENGSATNDEVATALLSQQQDGGRLGEIIVERGTATPAAVADALATQAATAAPLAEGSVRVDVGLLDKLMNLVGELVLARNQILQYGIHAKDTTFQGTTQRLNLITTELQEGVMKTRMQPIGNVWSKFPRVVRDLSHACGKQVTIEMEGKDTDLDRTIIEAIKDPLTHVVRNSVDHGIETVEVRLKQGKPAAGKLLLRAFHEGGQVNIEISDDGAGIDPMRVRKKAIDRGLITPERAARMSEREIIGLIFLPGFSTAEKVTNVSGRGVGMDVVKTNIEKIGGTVDIQSRPGAGTTLRIKIPLTLAIIPALIVTTRGERFAIPQVSLLELVRLDGEQARAAIERVHGAPVYRLRGNLLPLVYLDRALGFHPAPAGTTEDAVINLVVVQADGRQFGLVVDGVSDTEEIVVKPLGKELKGLTSFAGATIMGDGRVALILDVFGVAQRANVITAGRDRGQADEARPATATAEERETLLLFRLRDGTRMALPLAMVARLEEFTRDAVEHACGGRVVQYRNEILPLVDLGEVLTGATDTGASEDPLQVIVYSENGQSVGIVVDRILDIVDEHLQVKKRVNRHGILGASVIQGKVTDLLDIHGVIGAIDAGFFTHAA